MHNILLPRCMVKKQLLRPFCTERFCDRKPPHVTVLDFKYLFAWKDRYGNQNKQTDLPREESLVFLQDLSL